MHDRQKHTQAYIYSQMHTCIDIFSSYMQSICPAYISTCWYTNICTHIHAHTHIHTYAHAHTYICSCIYIYVYIYIYGYTYICVCMCTQNSTTQTSLAIFDSFHPVTITQLHAIMKSSKPTSCALDPIPTSLLLECLNDILPTLTHIIYTSILSGQFPTYMKTAIVKPL